jgi:hypothetical protein
VNAQLVKDYEKYANGFGQGFLKSWKATNMLITLRQIPSIIEDEVRFLTYLKNCLEMEGFRSQDIELIMGWLYERKDEISG